MRSVVIRMNIDEMPTACGPCELSCTAICKEWTKVDRKEIGRTKSPNCPILAILPEGHGRLIDWDAFERAGFKLCRKTNEWRAELGTPTNESYVVPAERSET